MLARARRRHKRRQAVEQLWTADGVDATSTLMAQGYDEITARVTSAYERFVATGEYRFRPRGRGRRSPRLGVFRVGDGECGRRRVAGGGRDFFLLAADGRIRGLYQFGAPAR